MDILSCIGRIRTIQPLEAIDKVNYIVIDTAIDSSEEFCSELVGYEDVPLVSEDREDAFVWSIDDVHGTPYKLYICLDGYVPVAVARGAFYSRDHSPEFFEKLKNILIMESL